MNAICVDDERLLVTNTVAMCREIPVMDEVQGFTRGEEALSWLGEHPVDLAFLDIHMPEMDGLSLAARIKERWPDVAVIFVTCHAQHAVDAFAVRASGYLLKPVTRQMLEGEIAYVLSQRPLKRRQDHVMIQTFGNFDVFVDGKAVRFKMARCKEILAYLVDKQGSTVTRAEVFSALWEDREYDRPMQKQLDVYIRSLRSTLKEYDIEEIFDMSRGTMRVIPDRFTCDSYLFFRGDSDAVNSYRGEYMSNYSWASMTESVMYWTRWKDQ